MLTPKFIGLLCTLTLLCNCQNHNIDKIQLLDHQLSPVSGATVRLESTSSGYQTPIAISSISDTSGVVIFKEQQSFNKHSFVIVQTPQMEYAFDYHDFRFTSSNLILIEGVDPESYMKYSSKINLPNKTLHPIAGYAGESSKHDK